MNFKQYDFLDFGCSNGANIKFITSHEPESRGLGIDIDQKKIDKATLSGFEAINFDILNLPNEKLVSFVTMSHFLEHLPSLKMAESMIRKGISVSREFILIRQPWFDSDGALLLRDLKFYWSDWTGHPNKMTSLDFYLILKRALADGVISSFQIYGRMPVSSTAEPSLIPLDAPINQHNYDMAMHGEKNTTDSLNFPTYKEIVVVVKTTENDRPNRFLSKFGPLQILSSRP